MAGFSIIQLPMLACGWREARLMIPPPMHDSTVLPCFHGGPLPSTGISYHSLLPHTPSICFSAVLTLELPPESLNSSSQLPPLPEGFYIPVQGMYGFCKDCLILIQFRLPQIGCFTLSLKCSPLTQTTAWMWGLDCCFSSPTC